MKKYIIVVVIVLIISSAIVYSRLKRKNESMRGLGKLDKKSLRPPRMRVIYKKKSKKKERVIVISSLDAYKVFTEIWSSQKDFREEAYALFIDNGNRVIGYALLSTGGLQSTIIDSRLVFSIALNCFATSIIIAHNHPSGLLVPSELDIDLTIRMKEAGELLKIPLIDHIIIAENEYYSMADEGII